MILSGENLALGGRIVLKLITLMILTVLIIIFIAFSPCILARGLGTLFRCKVKHSLYRLGQALRAAGG
jgi:hypothetical protein